MLSAFNYLSATNFFVMFCFVFVGFLFFSVSVFFGLDFFPDFCNLVAFSLLKKDVFSYSKLRNAGLLHFFVFFHG